MKKRIMSPARFDFSWFRRTAYQQTELHGSGMMRNLFAAASRSPEVADTLKVYGMAVTREEQNNLLDQLLLGWAATCVMDDMQSAALQDGYLLNYIFPDVGGNVTDASEIHLIESNGSGGFAHTAWCAFMAQQSAEYLQAMQRLSVLEKFSGKFFTDYPEVSIDGRDPTFCVSGPSLSTKQASRVAMANFYVVDVPFTESQYAALHARYEGLRDRLHRELLLQHGLHEYFDAITFVADARGGLVRNYSAMEALLDSRYEQDPVRALMDLVGLVQATRKGCDLAGWHWRNRYQSWVQSLQLDEEARELIQAFGACLEEDGRMEAEDPVFMLTPKPVPRMVPYERRSKVRVV